ncbi:MAG: branched-chain amino acid ABC transporter permease, partial [Chloroflexota bacterium]
MATVAQTHDPLEGFTGRWGPWLQALFWLVCLICVAGYPFVFSDGASTTVAFYTLVFAATGVAWNLFSGFTGYIALGHAVFFGVGQYALAIICARLKVPGGFQPFEYVPLVGLVAAAFAIPLGLIALRTRRHTFIVITIAFVFIFQLLAENNIFGLTKGQGGLEYPIPLAWHGASYNIPFYYAMVIILILVVAVAWLVRHSKYGLELLAIRDDEDRALGLGVRTTLLKLSAFTISGFFVGMAGAVYGYFQLSVYPAAGQATGFSPLFDVLVALMAFLGGLGTISGPLLGALLIEPAYLQLNIYFGDTGWNLVLYGAGFLVVILLLPQGIVPAVS